MGEAVVHRRGAEGAETAQRNYFNPLRFLRALCVCGGNNFSRRLTFRF
jgi:hypothetical protein